MIFMGICGEKYYAKLKERALNLPNAPGVYLFLGQGRDEILYIGKAKNLKKRVVSYFANNKDARTQIGFLLSKVKHIDWVATTNEKEAFILEDQLIKKRKPCYNIRFKDDKTYINLVFDLSHPFPRPKIVRRPNIGKNLTILGPYPSAGVIRDLLRTLEPMFPLRTCSDLEMKNRARPCIRHSIGLCSAPCVGLIDQESYLDMVKGVIAILKGRLGDVTQFFKARIQGYAGKLEFEKAASLRDRLVLVNKSLEEQSVISYRGLKSADIWGIAHIERSLAAYRLKVRGGKLEDGYARFGEGLDVNQGENLVRLLTDVYKSGQEIPDVVYVPFELEEREGLKEVLKNTLGREVKIAVAQKKGAVRSLSIQACENARGKLIELSNNEVKHDKEMLDLKMVLDLRKLPRKIACFDVSNLSNQDVVASMVVFYNARPKKDAYRHFIIKGLNNAQNDFLAMKEVVSRAFKGVNKEIMAMDLVVIDGGKGQLNAAISALKSKGVKNIPIIGLAKKKSMNSFERIIMQDKDDPLVLPDYAHSLSLLKRVRNEAHRFAIMFHRKRRTKRFFASMLDGIPGIGKAYKQKLIAHFECLEKINEASLEELAFTLKISLAKAAKIKNTIESRFTPD